MSPVTTKKVCIIGAGNSGLGAAKIFKSHGHDVTVIESNHDLGGVWEPSRSYPDVHTQTPGDLYSYSDFPMPAHYPEWPDGQQMYQYFTDYAEQNELLPLIQFNTRVKQLHRRTDTPGWNVELEHDSITTTEAFDFVVVCTGLFSKPKRLQFPGQDEFITQGGCIMHSSEYTDPGIAKNKRVTVLGFSKSATDIAVNAVENGATSVTIVYRDPVWRIPHHFGDLINFKYILFNRLTEKFFKPWDTTPLEDTMYKLAKPLIWLNWRGLETLLKSQFKLDQCNMTPTTPIEEQISCSLPVATPGFFEMIRNGRIQAVHSTFDHYEGTDIILENGDSLATDIAIMAVGWEQNTPYLSDEQLTKLVDEDRQYRLYRWIVNPDLPDIGFVGHNSSFISTLTGEISAHWLVRYMDEQLERMPTPQMMNDKINDVLAWRREERPSMANYGGLCIAPYHFRHLDTLLEDIGAKTHRDNPIVAQMAPINPQAYQAILASAPNYRAQESASQSMEHANQ